MIRGTTPTIVYSFPIDVSGITKLRIYFMQGSEPVIIKDETDCEYGENKILVRLTEEDTLMLTAKKRLEIRIRFVLNNETVVGTKSQFLDISDTGNDEILLNGSGGGTIPQSEVYIYSDVLNLAEEMGWVGDEEFVSDVEIDSEVTILAEDMGWIGDDE